MIRWAILFLAVIQLTTLAGCGDKSTAAPPTDRSQEELASVEPVPSSAAHRSSESDGSRKNQRAATEKRKPADDKVAKEKAERQKTEKQKTEKQKTEKQKAEKQKAEKPKIGKPQTAIEQGVFGKPITKVDTTNIAALIQDEKKFRRVTSAAWKSVDEPTCAALIQLHKRWKSTVLQIMRLNASIAASGRRRRIVQVRLNGPVACEFRAKEALKRVGPVAAPAMAGADETAMLRMLGKAAIPYLVKAAENTSSPNRVASYFALRRQFRHDKVKPMATRELMAVASSKHRWHRVFAVEELGGRKEDAAQIVNYLIAQSGRDFFEQTIARALTRLPAEQEKSIAWLARRVSRYRAGTRDYRGTSDYFLVTLVEFARSKDPKVGKLAAQAVCDRLKAAWEFNDQDYGSLAQAKAYSLTRIRLAKEIAKLGQVAEPAVPTLAAIITTRTKTKTINDKLWARILQRERPSIAVALARINTAAARQALRDSLQMGYQEALEGLKLLKTSSGQTEAIFRKLAQQLKANSPRGRWDRKTWPRHKKTCELLQKAGPAAATAAPILLTKMEQADPTSEAFKLYAKTLKSMGPQARAALTRLLMDRYQRLRLRYGRLSSQHAAVVGEFHGIGAQATPAVDLLLQAAKKLKRKRGVIRTLGEIATADPSVAARVLPLLQSHLSQYVNCGVAADAIGSLAGNAQSAVPTLRAALFRTTKISSYDRYRVARALAKVSGPRSAAADLQKALKEKLFRGDYSSRKRAERLLASLTKPSKTPGRRSTIADRK